MSTPVHGRSGPLPGLRAGVVTLVAAIVALGAFVILGSLLAARDVEMREPRTMAPGLRM